MDYDELRRRHEHLETATDAAYMLRELEWKNSGLSDEELAPEYNDMFRRLEALSKRSLRESLEHTDPRALELLSNVVDGVVIRRRSSRPFLH